MKKLMILLLVALSVALFGCGEGDQAQVKVADEKPVTVAGPPKTLTIEWQRMIDEEGNVCCGSEATRMAVETARAKLAEELEASGIEVILLRTDFTPEECIENPERANCILIAGCSVDCWLKAETVSSPCEGFCKEALGDKGSCQNLLYEGKTYEVIPAELIVKAGLAAAAHPATFKAGGKCGGCPSQGFCPSTRSKCDPSCKGQCPKCTGEEAACTCEGECDGSCHRDDDATTKAAPRPDPRACGRKGCAVGG